MKVRPIIITSFILFGLAPLLTSKLNEHCDGSVVREVSHSVEYQIKENHVKTAVSFMKEMYPLANNLKVKFIKPSELSWGSYIVSTFDYMGRIYTVKLKCDSTICLVIGDSIK